MRRLPPSASSGFSRLNIARAVSVMVVIVLVLGAGLDRSRDHLSYPEPVAQDGFTATTPIDAEAGVFRVGEGDLAVAPDFADTRPAHPRTMAMYRRLRAYPGAPPRVPHGLTTEEFRTVRCNVCHERGGWVARFGTWAPVTPHPEYGSCLQCHAPRDEVVGRELPGEGDEPVCSQCHLNPDARAGALVPNDWRPGAWPEIDVQAMEGSPNLVPHDFQLRSDCLACHAGPAAIAELRTDHPQRVNCRQCHVPVGHERSGWSPPTGSGTAAGTETGSAAAGEPEAGTQPETGAEPAVGGDAR